MEGKIFMEEKFQAATLAFREALPLALPVIPLGMVFGILAGKTGLRTMETVAMSALVFAGASQFVALTMLGSGAAASQIVLATFMINARHLFMGASLAPYFRGSSRRLLVGAAGVLTDESYALSINSFARRGPSMAYYLCTSLLFYLVWISSTTAGVVWAGAIPDVAGWGLDFALLGAFIGLLAPQVRGRGGLAALLVAGVVSLAGSVLSVGHWYITAGAVGGAVAGWWVETYAS